MPGGKIGDAEVSYLAGAYQVIERGHHTFDRRHRVEVVELQEVDVVRAEALECFLGGFDEMVSRGARIIGALARTQSEFGGKDHLMAAAHDRGAQDRLRPTVRVHI